MVASLGTVSLRIVFSGATTRLRGNAKLHAEITRRSHAARNKIIMDPKELSQYVHIGYITQALYCWIIRITFVAEMCSHAGPEHLMSIVEKKTVSLYSITM